MNEHVSAQHPDTNASTFLKRRRHILQRNCTCGKPIVNGGECAECRKKRLGLQRQAANRNTAPDTAPPIVHDVLRSPGRPLGDSIRTFMETRFGHDFSSVRVHTGDEATQSAKAVNAVAYTIGRNVVFSAGKFLPGTAEGKSLLAHELTHVVQQKTLQKNPSRSIDVVSNSRLESEAAANSDQFEQISVLGPGHMPPMLQRQEVSGRRTTTAPAQRLESRPAMHPSLLGGPCACLVFIHNDERNARRAAEDLHRNCRYNLAIIGTGRRRTVPIRGGNGRIDPNELFPADVQEECARNEAGCVAYEESHDDLRAMQIQFFLTIKACSNNFRLPTIALHNNSIGETRSFLRTTSAAERERLRGDFSRETGEGIGSRQDLRSRLGRRRGIMSRSGTTNIFRWCNLPEIGRCHIGDPDHPDDVIWVTNIQDFERLRLEDVNVVLQEGLGTSSGTESDTDLSTLFLRLGPDARYINIETPITPQDQATRARNMSFIQRVLDHIDLNCCEPIGDFPTPSRTEMIT